MRDVFVIGTGQSDFGKTPERSAAQMGRQAALEAIADAGIRPADLQGVFSSRVFDAMVTSQGI